MSQSGLILQVCNALACDGHHNDRVRRGDGWADVDSTDFAVRNENLEEILDELGVEWLDESEDESVEAEVFDLRSHWRALRVRRHVRKKIIGVLAKFFSKPSGAGFRPN